jgi:hypothetical protein
LVWKRKIARGMRESKRRRRKMGWLSYAELAAATGWPERSLKAMDELKKIRIGRREYVAASEVEHLRAA